MTCALLLVAAALLSLSLAQGNGTTLAPTAAANATETTTTETTTTTTTITETPTTAVLETTTGAATTVAVTNATTTRAATTAAPATTTGTTAATAQRFTEDGLPVAVLRASGATFPQVLVRAWNAWVNATTKGAIQFNYTAGGSGRGVSDFLAGNTDFSCSDAPLTAVQYGNATSGGAKMLHLPFTLGAVIVVASNKGFTQQFWLTPELIALIFSGKLRRWDDPRLLAVNGGTQAFFFRLLAGKNITVVRRQDSSGTTFAFTDMMARMAPAAWNSTASNLPTFRFWANETRACPGNDGVAKCVQEADGAVAYIEAGQARALSNNVSIARTMDASCTFTLLQDSTIAATLTSSLTFMPRARTESWTGTSLAGVGGFERFPSSTLSYMFVRPNQVGRGPRGAALKAFVLWMLTPAGQEFALDVGLVPLPQSFAKETAAAISAEMKVDNETLVEEYTKLLAPKPREVLMLKRIIPRPSSAGRRGGSVPYLFTLLALLLQFVSTTLAQLCTAFLSKCNPATPREPVLFLLPSSLYSAQYAPLWTAMRFGTFDSYCLAANVDVDVGGAAVIQKVGSGEAQFGFASLQDLLIARQTNKLVSGVLQLAKKSTWLLLAHKASASRPKGIARADAALLRDKIVQQVSVERASLSYLLASNLRAADFEYVTRGAGQFAIDAFLAPDSESTAIEVREHIELATILTTRKSNTTLYTLNDFHVLRFDGESAWADDVLVVNSAWYAANETRATNAVASLLYGYSFCRDNAISCAAALQLPLPQRYPSVLAVDRYMGTVFDGVSPFGKASVEAVKTIGRALAREGIQLGAPNVAAFVADQQALLLRAAATADLSDEALYDAPVSTLKEFCPFSLAAADTAAPCDQQFDEIDFVKKPALGPEIIYIDELEPLPPVEPTTLSGGAIAGIVIGIAAFLLLAGGLLAFQSIRNRRAIKERQRDLEAAQAELVEQKKAAHMLSGDAVKIIVNRFVDATPEERQAMVEFQEPKCYLPTMKDAYDAVQAEVFPLQLSTTRITFGLGEKGTRLVSANVGETLTQTFKVTNATPSATAWQIAPVPANFLYQITFQPSNGTLSANGGSVDVTARMVPLACKKIRTAVALIATSAQVYTELKIVADIGGGQLLDPSELQLAELPVSKGAAGAIFEGVWRGQHVAIKQFEAQEQLIKDMANRDNGTEWAEFMLEVQVLTRLRHKKVVSYVGAVVVPNQMAIVTEWIPLGSLMSCVQSFEVGVTLKAKLALDVAEALAYCHTNNILHRDVKPSNVLIESMSHNVAVNAKLADFGSSREEASTEKDGRDGASMANDETSPADDHTRFVGTPVYMAPEIISGEKNTAAADIYSFGMLIYFTFLEVSPWHRETKVKKVAKKVQSGKRPPLPTDGQVNLGAENSDESVNETANMPPAIAKFVKQAWAHAPTERPSSTVAVSVIGSIMDSLPPAKPATLREGFRLPSSTFGVLSQGTVSQLTDGRDPLSDDNRTL
jgi:phosphate transport system substrate-binding protein